MYNGQYHAENDQSNYEKIVIWERQKFSESHKSKRFGAWNKFRAKRFVTVFIIARSISAMKWVVEN